MERPRCSCEKAKKSLPYDDELYFADRKPAKSGSLASSRRTAIRVVSFDHAGTVTTVKLTDGTTMTGPPPCDTPYTYIIGELFKIKNSRAMNCPADTKNAMLKIKN